MKDRLKYHHLLPRSCNGNYEDIQNFGDIEQRGNAVPRKEFFSRAAKSLLLPAAMTSMPEIAFGAVPVTLKDTDSLLAITKRKIRQKPPKVLRRKLSRDFAVLLMRSSYNALDSIDCVAMVGIVTV